MQESTKTLLTVCLAVGVTLLIPILFRYLIGLLVETILDLVLASLLVTLAKMEDANPTILEQVLDSLLTVVAHIMISDDVSPMVRPPYNCQKWVNGECRVFG